MMSGTRTITVSPLPPASDAYPVVVEPGLLDNLAGHLASVSPVGRHVIIADSNVSALFGGVVVAGFRTAGKKVDLIEFDAGEEHKTRETWARLTDRLLELECGRDTCVVALGGGVTGDVAGFVAATFMRGVPFIQVPTTLLAMLDASVGGKTGVDTAAGKNLVGAFHQPRGVYVDPRVLRSLPENHFRSGLAEAVKHGAIADSAYLRRIAVEADGLLTRGAGPLAALISRSVEIKAEVVAEDPFESGRRATLNFGHTIGHALEVESGFEMPHGFAVSIGMLLEAEAGECAGVTQSGTAAQLRSHLVGLDLPVGLPPGFSADGIVRHTYRDKKARSARPRYALLREVGIAAQAEDGSWTHELPEDVVLDVVRRSLA